MRDGVLGDGHQGASEPHRPSAEGCEFKTMLGGRETAQGWRKGQRSRDANAGMMDSWEKSETDLLGFYTAESISSGVG